MPVRLWGDDPSTNVEEFAPPLASKHIERQANPEAVGSPYHWMSKSLFTQIWPNNLVRTRFLESPPQTIKGFQYAWQWIVTAHVHTMIYLTPPIHRRGISTKVTPVFKY